MLLAAGFNVLGGIDYLVLTLRGSVRPNRVTWLVWALAPLIAFAAELGQGVGLPAVMTFMVGFMPLLILVATFVNRSGAWRLGRLDVVCGALSLIGLGLWALTRVGNVAIVLSILADFLAAVPTIVKAFQRPDTEGARIYACAAVSASITLLTIHDWTFSQYAFPVYILAICIPIFGLVRFRIGSRIMSADAGRVSGVG